MVPSHFKTVMMIPPVTTSQTAASTNTAIIDTKGYDYLCVDLVENARTAVSTITQLSLAEDDTSGTYAQGTNIVALTGGAAVGATSGFVLPTPSSTTDNNYRLNLDLRGRKRYISIMYEPAHQTGMNVQALLFRNEEGAAMPLQVVTTKGCRLVVSA